MALIDPAQYTSHALHRSDRIWAETNCYADLWIEMLHARGLDPLGMLAFTLRIDFEGDQWTFFKPEPTTLRRLYGVEVEELNIWQDHRTQTREQLERGRWVMPEVDAYFLPDTAATDYRRQHKKTTIGIFHLDEQRCDYFHNAGCFTVSGDDLHGLFEARELPLYSEFVKFDSSVRRDDADLRERSRVTFEDTLLWLPRHNPVRAFAERLVGDGVTERGLEHWNGYAFSTLRQCGSAFELAGDYLRWLDSDLNAASDACHEIAIGAKALILKGARAANRAQAFDATDAFAKMADAWDLVVERLRAG